MGAAPSHGITMGYVSGPFRTVEPWVAVMGRARSVRGTLAGRATATIRPPSRFRLRRWRSVPRFVGRGISHATPVRIVRAILLTPVPPARPVRGFRRCPARRDARYFPTRTPAVGNACDFAIDAEAHSQQCHIPTRQTGRYADRRFAVFGSRSSTILAKHHRPSRGGHSPANGRKRPRFQTTRRKAFAMPRRDRTRPNRGGRVPATHRGLVPSRS